jgi:hypothetical protein
LEDWKINERTKETKISQEVPETLRVRANNPKTSNNKKKLEATRLTK